MAESELEARLNKNHNTLVQQVNVLNAAIRRTQAMSTHPAAVSNLNKQLKATDNTVAAVQSQVDAILANVPIKTIYTPDSLLLNTGTHTAGNVVSTQTPFDSDTYNITEVGGVPGFDIDFTFVAVDKFNRINLHIMYDGNILHRIQVKLYNTITLAWDDITNFSDQGGYFYWITNEGIPSVDYVDAITSEVKLKLYHVSNGNVLHHTQIDYISLVKDFDV